MFTLVRPIVLCKLDQRSDDEDFFSFIHALMVSKMKDTESSACRDRAAAGSDPVHTGLPLVRGRTESATCEPLPPQISNSRSNAPHETSLTSSISAEIGND